MRLDSVRDLKNTLTASLVSPLATSVATRRFLHVSARPAAAAAARGVQRTIALGIVKRRGDDYRLAIRVQRRALEASPEVERITRAAHGEVDVRYVGRVGKQAIPWYQRRNRPLRIGGSVGHHRITAGTVGCFVRSAAGDVLVLSNNHVLADENRAKAGDAILQPGRDDGGRDPSDMIGRLAGFVRVRRTGTNALNCATASLRDTVRSDVHELRGVGKLSGVGEEFLDEGTIVYKVGRTTGLTRGRVTAFEVDHLVVDYDIGALRFDNQVEIEGADDGPFSDGGDSGSLIVDEQIRAVGLLFAGGDQGGSNGRGLTYANPIRPVLSALKVTLLH